jgi:ADP-ribose pyrophosphatase YjhB (NUDIX family)
MLVRAIISLDGNLLTCLKVGSRARFLPGGHVEPGESVEGALRRELREELGVEVGAVDIWGVQEHAFVQRGSARHELNILFYVEHNIKLVAGALPRVKSAESALRFSWLPLNAVVHDSLLPRGTFDWCTRLLHEPRSVKKRTRDFWWQSAGSLRN